MRWGKVSVAGAWADYGVRIVDGSSDQAQVDEPASEAERSRRRGLRADVEPFFDRGPGYAALAGGARYADVDLL